MRSDMLSNTCVSCAYAYDFHECRGALGFFCRIMDGDTQIMNIPPMPTYRVRTDCKDFRKVDE